MKRWRSVSPRRILLVIGLVLLGWLLAIAIALSQSAAQPPDGVLVLGGSIQREIYAAQIARQLPQLPILISQGSEDPCIWLIFQRDQAPVHNVWLEHCADSTFGNFYFSLSILQSWRVRHVKLVTSPSHLPRSRWLGQIMLGAHGIWVTPDLVEETGIPGNQESWLKTSLDVTRGLAWAVASQFYQPRCSEVVSLVNVDMAAWRDRDFSCEHQAGLELE